MADAYLVDTPNVPFATNPELEALIRADRDDLTRYLVYADWLTAHGDPRGELAMVQHRLASDPENPSLRSREKAIFDRYGGFRGGVDAELVTFEWRLGQVRRLRIENEKDWMDSDFDAGAVARRLFSLPHVRLLDELAIGVLRWEYQAEDLPVVLAAAAESAFAGGLRRLVLGDVDRDVDNAHHSIGDISTVFAGAFPSLERVRVWGYEIATNGPLVHAKLSDFAVQTCALHKSVFEAIVLGRLPNIERLELWFGSGDYGCDVTVDDLRPLLESKAFPKMKHLGLRNAEFANEMIEPLLRAPILKQLESLDLSMGVLAAEGARALIERASSWSQLKFLDVSDSHLDDDHLEQLRAVGPEIRGDEQRDAQEGHRYVAVWE